MFKDVKLNLDFTTGADINRRIAVLNNGVQMPLLGIGCGNIEGEDVIKSIYEAIKAGYRLIDAASSYRNEKEVGIAIKRAIQEGFVTRKDLFVCSKAPFYLPGYQETLDGFEESLQNLGLEYIDLYFMHSPYWDRLDWKDCVVSSYRALEHLYSEGKIRAIGVSNFVDGRIDFLDRIAKIYPQVNQFEIHPFRQQNATVQYCRKQLIQTEAWGSLNQGRLFDYKEMELLAKKYNKSVAQIAIRWNLQEGNVALLSSTKPEEIQEDFDVWDFELSQSDMEIIKGLNGKGEWSHELYSACAPIGVVSRKRYWEELSRIICTASVRKQMYYLFGFIPFLQREQYSPNKIKYFLFGIPILKITKK